MKVDVGGDMPQQVDPRLFEPRYDIAHAAQYVRMPESTLRAWAYGQDQFRPVLTLPTRGFLSFVNLTEAFVLHAMRRRYRIALPRIREATSYVERALGVEHPLAFEKFKTDGVDLFVQTALGHINASRREQTHMDSVLADLERIEWGDHDRPVALFPLFRMTEEQRRPVRISPFVAFGKPVITGTGIPTSIVAQRFYAGESVEELSADYRVSTGDIEEAVRAEAVIPAA
ncbi:MAG TPA: DUF433 domain-containing protein [Candidatus Elarobacter sp.]|nr:DUF433 domain-containing protein [Candidatus Elarobacter sp.]